MNESAIINSNMIIDYDFSLWLLIKEKYNKYINKNLLKLNDNLIKGLLIDNQFKNPLHIILDNTISIEDKDSLYNDFMNTKKEELLKYECFYDNIIYVANEIHSVSFTDLTISCNDELEKKYLSNIVFKSIMNDDINYNNHQAIFVRYKDEVLSGLNSGIYFNKNIYMALDKYNCKLDEDNNIIFDVEFVKIIYKLINLNIISLYIIDENDILLG